MKNRSTVVALLVTFGLGFSTRPASAQDQDDHQIQLSALTTAWQNLQSPDNSNEVCAKFNRYAPAWTIDNYAFDPFYFQKAELDKLQITKELTAAKRIETAKELATVLATLLHSRTPKVHCSYFVSSYYGTEESINFDDKFKLVQEYRKLKKENPELQDSCCLCSCHGVEGVAGDSELSHFVLEFAAQNGDHLRRVFLNGYLSAPDSPSRAAGELLWELITKEKVAPSVMKLSGTNVLLLLDFFNNKK